MDEDVCYKAGMGWGGGGGGVYIGTGLPNYTDTGLPNSTVESKLH